MQHHVQKQAFEDLFEPAKADNALTKIICTLGSASDSTEALEDLVDNGMRGARVQLKSGSVQWAKQTILNLQEVEQHANTPVAVILDSIGPEVRVRPLPGVKEGEELNFEEGTRLTITRDANARLASDTIPVQCELPFTQLELRPGMALHVSTFLAIGEEMNTLTLRLDGIEGDKLACTVRAPCTLPAHLDMTVHGSGLHNKLPILAADDKEKIAALCDLGVHYLSIAYCRSAKDVRDVRQFLDSKGIRGLHLMAKICTPEAVSNISDILEAADGVVLARGTLGLELRAEKVFRAQKQCLRAANLAGKVCAVTQVLDSMVDAPRPTRAEATDVANLVLDGADCILLCDETSRGVNPCLVVSTVKAIARQAEICYDNQGFYAQLMDEQGGYENIKLSKTEALASSAVRATTKLDAKLVLAFTKTGRTARIIAKYRAAVPILVVVAKGDGGEEAAGRIVRQCALLRATHPLLALPSSTGSMSVDGTMTDWALRAAIRLKLVRPKERVVVSQCPRVLTDGSFEEAAVVKFVVAGDTSMSKAPHVGSCKDLLHMSMGLDQAEQ